MHPFTVHTKYCNLLWHYEQEYNAMFVWKRVVTLVTLPGGCPLTVTGNLTVGAPATTTLNECDIRIVAKDTQGMKTTNLPRPGTQAATPQSLTLRIESLDGTVLTGYSYHWTLSISTSAGAKTTILSSSLTLSATPQFDVSVGEYELSFTEIDNRTLVAYLTFIFLPTAEGRAYAFAEKSHSKPTNLTTCLNG